MTQVKVKVLMVHHLNHHCVSHQVNAELIPVKILTKDSQPVKNEIPSEIRHSPLVNRISSFQDILISTQVFTSSMCFFYFRKKNFIKKAKRQQLRYKQF